jgi:hypothetical protein
MPRLPRRNGRLGISFSGVVLSLLFAWTSPAPAEAPLHERIDQAVAAGKTDFDKQAAPLSSDAEFLRRVTLDLSGTIPTMAEARAFLDDPSPTKRERVIDRLLASPEYARHVADVFDVILMERRRDKYVPRAEWQEYLRASFAANKPWDELVRELLAADGADPKLRPAAKFYLDREAELHLVTRDIGRLFLGMNLQCAQCHDHPLVSAYKQDYYYGVFAFLNRTYLFNDKSKKGAAVLAEKADGEATFQSVFDPAKLTKTAGMHVPDAPLISEPKPEKGKEYAVAPAAGVRPVPKFSRRSHLPAQVAGRDNAHFKRNIANRLWALMMGRGLVHPLDFDHADNPPSHPDLLNVLAEDLAARKFDIKSFLRELALSKTYQRSSEPPAGMKETGPGGYAVARLKPLSPEQLAWALMQATGLADAERQALGKKVSESALHARLVGNVAPVVATFGSEAGHPEGEAFQATLDQALFLANGNLVRTWLVPRPGNLVDRLSKLSDPGAVADELYLSVLTRRATDEDRKEVAALLKDRNGDRTAALQDLAWALLASAEFRFNH